MIALLLFKIHYGIIKYLRDWFVKKTEQYPNGNQGWQGVKA